MSDELASGAATAGERSARMARMSDLDRGALAAIDLFFRGVIVTEDETTPEEHAEGIREAIREGGIGLAIRREIEFERGLNVPGEFSVSQTYGRFPERLRRLATPPTPTSAPQGEERRDG